MNNLALLARHAALITHAEAQEALLANAKGERWEELAREAIAARLAALELERCAA